MATGARLAAYLSGDLDPEEHAAVEAELARDPTLRDRLEQIRASDAALAGLPPVELSDEALDRLDRAVGRELDQVLGDELAARRTRRAIPRWIPAAAAAAVVVVVGGGIALTGSMSGSDDAGTMAEDAPEAALDGADGGGEAGTQATTLATGPRVVALDRTLDEQALRQLASDPAVLDALGPRDVDDAAAVAADYARALGVDPRAYFEGSGDTLEADQATEQAGAPEADAAATSRTSVPPLVSRGEVDEADRADVAACLPVLQEDASAPVVPLYAELGTDADGTEVIAYAALAPDANGEYQRIEVWLVDRESCTLRTFVQHDR